MLSCTVLAHVTILVFDGSMSCQRAAVGEAHGVKFVLDQCYVFIRARLVSLSHGEHQPGIGKRGGGERGGCEHRFSQNGLKRTRPPTRTHAVLWLFTRERQQGRVDVAKDRRRTDEIYTCTRRGDVQ